MKRFPSNLCRPQGFHRVQIRYGGTNTVPPGTTLRNVAQCAGLNTPSNVSTTLPQDCPPPPQLPPPTPPIVSKPHPPNHHLPQPTNLQNEPHIPPCTTPQEQDNLLQGKVAPQTENKLMKLRKIFELKNNEDNPVDKKKTTLTRKAEDARKSNQQAQGDHLELNNSDKVVKFRQEYILRRGPGISPVSVDDCDHGGTDITTTVVQSLCSTSTVAKPSNVLHRQDSLKRLLLQPVSPQVTEH